MVLAYEREGHVAKVGLNRPEEMNTLNVEFNHA